MARRSRTTPTVTDPPAVVDGGAVCGECFPLGPPADVTAFGCEHGSWELADGPAPVAEPVADVEPAAATEAELTPTEPDGEDGESAAVGLSDGEPTTEPAE